MGDTVKKFFKIVAILFVLLIVLLGAAFVALKIYFPPEKIKAIALEQLQAHLKREVRIGDVSIGILKGLGLSKLEISEASTFQQGTFVSVDELSIRVQWRPLLQKRIVVDSVTLNKPVIQVIRKADGKTYNFSDLVESTTVQAIAAVPEPSRWSLVAVAYAAPAQPAAAPAPQSFDLKVASFQIRSGRVIFKDLSPAKASAELSDLNLNVKNFSMDDFFSADWSLQAKTMGLQPKVEGAGKINLKTESASFRSLDVVVGESKFQATGDVKSWSAQSPQFDLKINLNSFNPNDFSSLSPLPKELRWTGAATGKLNAKGTPQAVDVSGQLAVDNVDLRYGKTFYKPAKTVMALSFDGQIHNQDNAKFQPFGLKLGPLSANGSLALEGLTSKKEPTIKFHVETNEFPVAEVAAFSPGSIPAGVKVSGPAKVSADISGTASATQVRAKITGKDLVLVSSRTFQKEAGIPLDIRFQGDVLRSGEQINLKPLTIQLARIQTQITGGYQSQGQDGKCALIIKTNDFPMADLTRLSPMLAGMTLSGTGRLTSQVNGVVSGPAAEGAIFLTGAGIKTPDGELKGIDSKINFQVPNAMADAPVLKTEGRFTAAEVKHEFYSAQSLKLNWALTDVTETLERVSGNAQLNQGQGILKNVEKLVSQYRMAKIALFPIHAVQKIQAKGLLKGIGLPSLESIPFDSIKGDYVFRQGTLDIKTFDLLGKDLNLNTLGTIGLAGAQPIDLKVVAKLAPGAVRGTLGQIIQDEQGRATFKFTATGSVSDPNVKHDMQDAGKKALQVLGQEIFKGLGGQKSNPTSPSTPEGQMPTEGQQNNAQQDPKKALEDLGNNLKNLFGR